MNRPNRTEEIDITEIFNQAWAELYCPPVRLSLVQEGGDDGDRPLSPAPFSVLNGTIYLKPDIVPRGCDPKRFLLWYFRHEMAHIHNCPYDIKTAYSLERAAYKVVGDWSLAYLATHIFADLQVNLNYLPKRFNEIPYIISVIGERASSLLDEILQGVYVNIHSAIKPKHRDISEAGREIATIISLNKTWHTKVQMIAIILRRLRSRCPRLFSKGKMRKFIIENPIRIREDFLPNSMSMIEETYGSITDQEEAREFFRHWVEPRLPRGEMEEAEEKLKRRLKIRRSRKKEKKGGGDEKKEGPHGGKEVDLKKDFKVSDDLFGDEPHLSTSLSKPYEKIGSNSMREAFWKRYWYRSRAERIIIQYLAESPSRRPVWSVAKYPDEWYIEDDIEDLDVEMSLDEGPLIPEVTTLKWVEEPTSQGQSIISGFVPSAITVLDSSYSMIKTHDVAAIAAFIAHLSAFKAGGQTSVVNFSTRYVSADWNSPPDVKELTLSMSFNEFTVFPAYEVMRLASSNRGVCFIVIITDGGWQNVDEAVPLLERMADLGHKIFIFQLPGGEYMDRIEFIKRSPHIQVYRVDKPEVDLQNLVLSESIRTYRKFLT